MVRTLLLLFIIIPIAAPAQNALKEREYIHTQKISHPVAIPDTAHTGMICSMSERI